MQQNIFAIETYISRQLFAEQTCRMDKGPQGSSQVLRDRRWSSQQPSRFLLCACWLAHDEEASRSPEERTKHGLQRYLRWSCCAIWRKVSINYIICQNYMMKHFYTKNAHNYHYTCIYFQILGGTQNDLVLRFAIFNTNLRLERRRISSNHVKRSSEIRLDFKLNVDGEQCCSHVGKQAIRQVILHFYLISC